MHPVELLAVLMMMVLMLRHFSLRVWALPLLVLPAISMADSGEEAVPREVTISQRHVLDWVPIDELSQTQRETLPPGSCGAYIAPVRNDLDATSFPDQAPLRALSNQTLYDDSNPDGASILLLGDVEVLQGYRQIKAQRAQYDDANGVLTADGPIEIREPGILMLGDRAVVNRDDDILLIEEGVFVIHPANTRGSAKRLTKSGYESLVLEDASFTRCEPGNNAWALRGSKITLDFDARQGYARNVRLEVAGVPVFYFPYIRFPLGKERLSGFLSPTLEYGEDGTTVSVPYYFNLAPNYDALWTLHNIEQHGLRNEINGRHLSRHFYTELNLSLLNNDRGIPSDNARSLINAGSLSPEEAVPFKDQDRWLFNLDQRGGEGQRWSTRIDFTRVSDVNFFRDFDEAAIAKPSDNKVDQRVNAAYRFDNWTLSAEALRYQPLSNSVAEPYQQLPELAAKGAYLFGDLDLSLNHQWIRFDHIDSSIATPIITGNRLRLDYDLGLNYEREWGFVKPTLAFKSLSYQLEDVGFTDDAETSQSISAPQFSLDTGLVFERKTDTYTQTFEPRLFFLNSPFRDHSGLFDLTSDGRDVDFDTSAKTFNFDQVFKNTRFTGGDRIDDANQVALGLSTRFLGQQSGLEWFSASLGQIFYFDDRRVTLNNTPETEKRSDIAFKFRANPTDRWQGSSDLIYDQSSGQFSRGNLGFTYTSAFDNVFDVNYRYVRSTTSSDDTRQVDASFIAPIGSHRWHLLWHGAYDISASRELDLITAVEYGGCCYSARLGYRHWLDNTLSSTVSDVDLQYDWQTFFEINFYGLGRSGKKLDAFFEQKIDGYQQWRATHSKD